ncbi:sce7725 family protein [Adhaeribacter pallidiroseus]|uniref:Sce7725 family protein n=1 Tax=Adhaeribacter pallidiroseus TaxID=2072847 RepID=A0A369Q6P7_9BACT|nr:sce7725 family protein [Adhaeribacter pallidiroseus]RDC58796.1 hypothetical protein AHMF7616_05230 [Adhaeribacter pallidiroseus]
MYFPYIRGKQFELIALREIRDILAGNNTKVSPIIEPVKNSPTLKKVLSELSREEINFNVIINPVVGDLIGSSAGIMELLDKELNGYSNYQMAIIIDESKDVRFYRDLVRDHKLSCSGVTLIHNSVNDNIKNILTIIEDKSELPIINNIINSGKTNRRYYRNFDSATLVTLDDFFCCQQKNSDYLPIGESQFSEEHLFYKNDGYKGFSDFLTIGDNYSDGGFLPFAIAIHLSYADSTKKIRVKHFVSDSNMDTSDIGGKFEEALNKLIYWSKTSSLNTRAIEEFKELHSNGHFPGLGSVKKLSVMNHIELVIGLI